MSSSLLYIRRTRVSSLCALIPDPLALLSCVMAMRLTAMLHSNQRDNATLHAPLHERSTQYTAIHCTFGSATVCS